MRIAEDEQIQASAPKARYVAEGFGPWREPPTQVFAAVGFALPAVVQARSTPTATQSSFVV